MANVETIMWTAVPNGVLRPPIGFEGVSELLLSVHVAPNLTGANGLTLADFPDFWNWPDVVNGLPLSFMVHIYDANGIEIRGSPIAANVDLDPLRPDLWTALFGPPGGVEVTPRDAGEPFTDLPVVSYPANRIADFIKTNYTNWTVGSPTEFPSLATLSQTLSDIGYADAEGHKRLGAVLSELAAARNSPPGPVHAGPVHRDTPNARANTFTTASDEQSFAALRFYHQRGKNRHDPVPQPAPPAIDFHRALTLIGEHRALQRALGLVFDLSVPYPGVDATTQTFSVSVTPNFGGGTVAPPGPPTFVGPLPPYVAVLPRTLSNIGDGAFEARAAGGEIVTRQLTLGDSSSFAVHQIDVDGSGIKTALFADNLKLSRAPQPGTNQDAGPAAPDAPQAYAPPSLRSAGITVTALDRGVSFVSKLDRSAALMSSLATEQPLTAEDLVRGFVLDVHDNASGAWHSTAMRTGSYQVTGIPDVTTDDEAALDAPPRMGGDANDPQFNLPENLVRWDGWSMAGPRPGLPIQDDGDVSAGGVDPGPFSQLKIDLSPAPGSLPKLRFGRNYALRMRVVDIAGNVIDVGAGADVGDPMQRVTPEATYVRFEPVASPDVYHELAPTLTAPPGESLKRLVIRGNYAEDAVEHSIRGFAPPRISQLFAEQHGMFDITNPSGTNVLDPNAYAVIVPRESLKYPDGAATAISPADPVPYLPDPLSRGAMLTIFDAPPSSVTMVPLSFVPAAGQDWPDYRPYQLVFAGGAQYSVVDDTAKRIVTILLAKGDTAQVQLSSYLEIGDLSKLGVFSWASEYYRSLGTAGAQGLTAYTTATTSGQVWAITPSITLELVYAVRQPLVTPDFIDLAAQRDLASTFVNLSGDVKASRKTMSKIDTFAQWFDPIDGGSGAPDPVAAPDAAHPVTNAVVLHTTVDLPNDFGGEHSVVPFPDLLDSQVPIAGRQEFFDTKHREVTYTNNATSRFTEYYVETATIMVAAAGTPVTLTVDAIEPGSVKMTTTDKHPITYAEGVAFTVAPGPTVPPTAPAGPTTITFLAPPDPAPVPPAPPVTPAVGSSVTVSFLPPVSRVSAGTAGSANVLSTARPGPVQIRDIVPIYGWTRGTSRGGPLTSKRSPSALRVFIERPWWSSGDGELLGVITYPPAEAGGVTAIPAEALLYVSEWGADPVFDGAKLPTAHPRLAAFTNSKPAMHGTGLTLGEDPALPVNVAGHTVAFDAERKLWYCDVAVNTGKAYTPMIRLALARYQPQSLPGVELSRVVLADIMSLEPGRTVAVTRAAGRHRTTLLESVTLSGYSYTNAANPKAKSADNGPGIAQVTVEVRDETVADNVLGWAAVGKPVSMKPTKHANGQTTWTAKNVKLPAHGTKRLFIEQYEVVPADLRTGLYVSFGGPKPTALRLLHQDLVPL